MTSASRIIERSKTIKSYVGRLLPIAAKLHLSRTLPNLAGLIFTALGATTLAWVGQLTWHDMTVWDKDIALIFFESRTGENISLGIGMKVIHYFLIGLALLAPGLVTLLRGRSGTISLRPSRLLFVQEEKGFSECPHHSGYLASRPKNTPIPQECLICPKILECMHSRNF